MVSDRAVSNGGGRRLLHVAIDEIDLLRMAGNAVVLVVPALAYRPGVPGAMMASAAATIVVALNLAFFIDRGKVPPAAFVLVAVSLVPLGVAVWRASGPRSTR